MPKTLFTFTALKPVYLLCAITFSFLSCENSKPASPEAKLRFESIIPNPVSASMTGNTFTLTNDTRVVVSPSANGACHWSG